MNITLGRRAFFLIAALLSITAPAVCGPISLGTWYQFSFDQPPTPAIGCAPNDPTGAFCFPSSGTPTSFLDSPPWTFVAPSFGATLRVVDSFAAGDRFEVFDFGVSLGLTSVPVDTGDCGDDPVPCVANSDMSQALFLLGGGAHSISIAPVAAPNGPGAGFLLAEAVPEPSTWLFLASGLTALAWKRLKGWFHSYGRVVVPGLAIAAVGVSWFSAIPATAQGPAIFVGPTSSQPLALTADNAFLASVNPDNNSVSFFDLRLDRNRKLTEVPVQVEPNGVALLPDGSKAYIANTISGTVSVIKLNFKNGVISQPYKHIPVGTEPYGLVMTPHGRKLYVSNARSNTVSVIDTVSDQVVATIQAGFEPRGLAVTNDGDDDDNDETVYVTQFLSLPVAGKVDGQDDSKAGKVTIISSATNTVTGTSTINPLTDTGFNATGDAIARIAPLDPANPANFIFPTGAYVNQLNNIAIKNGSRICRTRAPHRMVRSVST